MNINKNRIKKMRLIKENIQTNNIKIKLNKNKSLIDEIHNIKYKIENNLFQDKIRKNNNNIIRDSLRESNGNKKFQSNVNVYKPNKNIQNKVGTQIKKDPEKKIIYAKNKIVSLNTNNNINIGNNINIITNNDILENEIKNQENNKNNNIITEINIMKKPSANSDYSSTDKIINSINPVNSINVNNNRINRIKESIGNENKRFRGRNVSMEHINPKFSRDIIMSDADLTADEENFVFRKNNIYYRPNKHNSPKSFYNNNFNQKFRSINNDSIYTKSTKYKNHYFYNKDNDNLDEMGGNLYNNNYQLKYQKPNNDLMNRSSCKYNSTISYDNKPNKFNCYNYDNQTKTIDEIFLHKSIMNSNNRINKNLITNKDISYDDYTYSNNLKTLRNSGEINKSQKMRRNHSVIEDNDMALSPYKNYFNTNCNYLDDLNIFRPSRRSLNNVRIIKKNNNASIQEYNLSVGDDTDNREMDFDMDTEVDRYENKFIINKKNNRKTFNFNDNNMNRSMNENISLKKYYDNYSKNIQPISNSQLNIKGTVPRNYKMTNFVSKKNYNVQIDENSKNNNMSSPNFSIIGKSPKKLNHITGQKLKSSNNEINADNIIISNKNNNENIKRPKNDIRSSSSDIRGKSTSTKNINKTVNKNINEFQICHNEKINYFGVKKEQKDINDNKDDNKNNNSNNNDSNNENKFVFDNENDIIDYIYNKFEEERKKKSYFNRKLRFTGFVLSKKYKGKNLCDIRIEDDVDKINQQLKDEQILIGDKQVEFRFCEDKDNKENLNADYEDKINKINKELNELMEQNKKLKAENEKLNKKDLVKNDLIKKLDKEKENLIEEIEKLKEEIEKLNNNRKKDEDKLINIALKNIDNDIYDKDVDVDITINKKFNIKTNDLNSEDRNQNLKHNFKEILEKIKSSKIKKDGDGNINKKY